MNFFFENCSFDNLTLEELENITEKNLKYNIKFKYLLEKSTFCLKNSFLRIESISRASYLLRFRLMEEFEFFDTPSLEEMLFVVNKDPITVLQHLLPRTSQSLSLVINFFYNNCYEFIKMLKNTFSLDPTYFIIFANSTFPALYGYFLTDYFIKLAFDILIELINSKDTFFLFNSMFSSYFFIQYFFFNYLWSNIFNLWINLFTIEDMFLIFCTHLQKSFQFVSEYHIKLLIQYYNIEPQQCIEFFINEIIIPSLKLYFLYSEFQIPENILNKFINFLINLNINSLEFKILTNTFLNLEIFNPQIIILPNFNQLIRFPILFSDRDIFILLEICKDSEIISLDARELKKSTQISLKKGYSPLYVEITNPKINNNFLKNQKIEIINQNFFRDYQKLQNLSNNNSKLLIEYLTKTKFYNVKNIKNSLEFNIYSLKKFNFEISENLNNLDNLLNNYLINKKI